MSLMRLGYECVYLFVTHKFIRKSIAQLELVQNVITQD